LCAAGDYIGYVDGDDWIESSMYEELVLCAEKHLVDIVVSGHKEEINGEISEVLFNNIPEGYYSKERLREWFKMIYEVLFGDEQGPRMGSFISFYGIKETVNLINKSIND
jgi:lysyl-tRNA synthetase class 1